ncbi:tail fiber protein [Klebsiella phage 13]|uniref:Tail fiber protein n=1 Tax=Klebsiella phage 13 TaxID=2488573 RepID=A0A5K7NLY5_9CAUD|nr:tail fiber protein [Klebsiella phage 13]AZF89844.1 tail fiber protein [Klebsiella phage 13]
MALYRQGKAAMDANGVITGTGTKWQSSLSLIRPGSTIMFLSSPIQMAVINKVVSDTQINAITTNGAVVPSSDYAILLSDSLTVDGLAQDVAETLRYYQSQETVIADAVDFFKDFDLEALQNLANQVKADSEAADASAAAAAASESAAKTSEINAKASEVAAETARDQVQHIIDNAGDQSTLAVLAQSSGLKNIGQCANITALRSLQFSSVGQQVFLKEHTSGQNAGGGVWYCHSLTNDASYVDDNGCQIINNYGQVIRRKDVKELTSSYFGLRAGDTIDHVLTNMYKASRTFNIYEAKIENPGFDKGYVLQGGLRFYCGDKPFYILSYSLGTLRGPNLWHTGDNIGITFSRFKTDGTSEQAWSGGGIRGFRFWGAASYLVQGNEGVNATPVRLSDMWQGEACDFWVTGYTGNTNGAVVSLYNEFAWTEGSIVENIMVRQSIRGLTFLRNPGTTATDSFFRIVADMSFNAGVSGKSTQVMVVGDGTPAGACLVYGHDIKLTQWMSAGSWHDIVRLEDHSIIAETGVIKIVADGYGISKSTVPAAEVVHSINVRGLNARFRSRVENWSNQAGGWGLDFLNIIFQSSMYTNAMTFYESDFDALPTINPVGMKIRFNGTFTVDERQSGKVYTLNGLIPGMTLKVKLTSRNGNDLGDAVVQEWKVFVRSTNFPCIVVPMSGGANIATTDGLAVTNTSPVQTATFLKTVTPTQARNFIGQNYGLTVKNANDDNSLSYAVNSGRKIRFILPANPGATTTTPYSVEIEVL